MRIYRVTSSRNLKEAAYRVFPHGVTAAMFASQTNPMEAEVFCYVNN